MTVKIFGKEGCPVCKQVKEKFGIFINHWKIADKIRVSYYNLDSIDDLAEAAMQDATDVPAVIIEKEGKELARWTGRAVQSNEFKPYFAGMISK